MKRIGVVDLHSTFWICCRSSLEQRLLGRQRLRTFGTNGVPQMSLQWRSSENCLPSVLNAMRDDMMRYVSKSRQWTKRRKPKSQMLLSH